MGAGSASIFFVPENAPDLFFQRRQPVYRIVPENRCLDPEIDVGENIAEPDDLFPVRLRVPFPEILRQVLDRFTNHFKISDDRIPAPPVVGKFLR